jgi:prevent-host-death family protein
VFLLKAAALELSRPQAHILARKYGQKAFVQKTFAMSRKTWSVQDAKDRFSAVVEAARRSPQTVTKHGKPAVVIVAADEYERLRQLERLKAPSFTEHLLAIPRDDHEFQRLPGRLRDVEV